MSKQNIEVSKQIHTIFFFVIWLKYLVKSVLLSVSCFSLKKLVFFLKLKPNNPLFTALPNLTKNFNLTAMLRLQNDNTIFFTSEKNRIAIKMLIIRFSLVKKTVRPIKRLIRFSKMKI